MAAWRPPTARGRCGAGFRIPPICQPWENRTNGDQSVRVNGPESRPGEADISLRGVCPCRRRAAAKAWPTTLAKDRWSSVRGAVSISRCSREESLDGLAIDSCGIVVPTFPQGVSRPTWFKWSKRTAFAPPAQTARLDNARDRSREKKPGLSGANFLGLWRLKAAAGLASGSRLACLAGPGRPPIRTTCAHGEWRPPERLAQFLPPDFVVPLDCYTGPDGLRRILPRCSFEELIDLGVVGGLAVIHGIKGFNKESDALYQAMLLVHQHVRGRRYLGTHGMKEHRTREFHYSRDLYVRRSGRVVDSERDVLPDDIGVNAQGEGRRLTVTQLTEHGRQDARQAGHRNPTGKPAISFGLYEAAKLNPSEMKAAEVRTLVEMALIDTDLLAESPSPELVDIVEERLLLAIHRHRDDSREAFYRWFLGPKKSLVKQIAQQKGKRGGELSRDDVRRVFLHLGLRAYEYLGPCVNALMRTIKHSIPQPLNDEEKRLFEHMHESQPYYGDLPPAMLAERMSDIKLAVLAIWDEPQNQEHVRVLHRLLSYYAEMARKRRPADSQSKQRCPQVTADTMQKADGVGSDAVKGAASEYDIHPAVPHRGGPVQLIENLHSSPPADQGPFTEVAEHIRQLHRIECEAGCNRWEYYREGESDQPVTIWLRCECGQIDKAISMPLNEFAKQAEEVLRCPHSLP